MNRSVGRWALLLACLLFAVLGQLYFAKRPQYFWDGVLLYAVAAACLVALTRAPAAEAQQVAAKRRSREGWLRLGLTLLGIILGAAAVLQLRTAQPNYWPVFWTWVGAMLACLLAAMPLPRDGWTGFRAAVQEIRPSEALVVLALFALALALRAWRVDSIPWTLSGDEGNFGRWSREVLDGRLINMFSTGHLSMPSLYAFFQAAWLKLAGDNVFGLRLPWAVMGALSVVGAYLLTRRLFGRGLATLVALLLAGYSYHIHYSRLGLNNIADPFFVVWALHFFVMGWQSGARRPWPWVVAGLLSGLAFYFYTGGRQVPVILLGIIVWAALTDRDFWPRSRDGLRALVIAFAVAVGPMALYAVQHPDDFNARMNQVGIIQTGWLAQQAEMLGRSELAILAEQFRKVFFAFTHYLDRTDFYRPSTPLLDFPASILFLLGVVLSLTRLVDRRALINPHPSTASGSFGADSAQDAFARGDASRTTGPASAQDALSASSEGASILSGTERLPAGRRGVKSKDAGLARPIWRYAVFVIWFFGVIVAGGVLTDNAPSSQRIVSSSIPAMFFVALALRELANIFASLAGLPNAGRRALALTVAAVLAFGSARYYFGPYQDSWVYGSFNGEVSTAIGHTMQRLGPEWKQYFFGAPRMWAEFGSATFISKNPYLDVVSPLAGPPEFVDPAYNAAFIFLPERIGDLDYVRQAYPDGQLFEVHRYGVENGPLLFTAYTVAIK